MTSNTFILLYNHQYHPSPKPFHHPKLKLSPLNTNSPFLSPFPLYPLRSLATTVLFPVPVNLATPNTSYKWNHTTFVFLQLAYSLIITSSKIVRVVECIIILFLFEAEEYSLVCIHAILFMSASLRDRCCHLLSVMNVAAVNVGVQYLFESLLLILLDIHRVELLSDVVVLVSLFRSHHADCRSGYTI